MAAIGRPLHGLVVLSVIAVILAGCVVIPYKPGSETQHDLSEVPNPELVRLTVGRRKFLDGMTKETLKQDKRLQPVDGQTFIDTVSPTHELTLAQLLEPSVRPSIESLQVDYLVVFGEPEDASLGGFGGFAPLVGIGGGKGSTTCWAAVIDLRQQRMVEQLRTKSTGTDAGIWFWYGVFVTSDTRESAQQGVARRAVEAIANDKPPGLAPEPVRVVLLTSERIPSAEELARQAEERTETAAAEQEQPTREWFLRNRPQFEEAPPPAAGFGLVYIYQPGDIGDALAMYAGPMASAVEVAPLWYGAYSSFYPPAGPLELSIRWVYMGEDVATPPVTLDVKPGATYYVRAEMVGFFPKPRMNIVAENEGRVAIAGCVLARSAQEANAHLVRQAHLPGHLDEQIRAGWLYANGVNYLDGQSLPQDYVEAYKWFHIAESIEGNPRFSTRGRKYVAARMDAAQIAEAERRVRDWKQAHRQP